MPPKRSKQSSFPAARIKRIMQQDDDVGKVAGASPLVMSKAVELFLQEMLQAIEQEARSKGTRKVSMYHVKRAVLSTPSLDFLKDLVSSVPDPSGPDGVDDGTAAPKPKRTRAPKKSAGSSLLDGGTAAGPSGPSRPAKNGISSQKAKTTVKANDESDAEDGGPLSAVPTHEGETIGQEEQKVAIPISSLLGPSPSASSSGDDKKGASAAASRRNDDMDEDYDDDE